MNRNIDRCGYRINDIIKYNNLKKISVEIMNEEEKNKYINKFCDEEVDEEPFIYTMSLISGKWKMHILFLLSKRENFRYGELKRKLGKISHKMLSNQLKELENDDLIIRTQYNEVPPKVEYSLSKRGKSLMPVLSAICTWGHNHINEQKE